MEIEALHRHMDGPVRTRPSQMYSPAFKPQASRLDFCPRLEVMESRLVQYLLPITIVLSGHTLIYSICKLHTYTSSPTQYLPFIPCQFDFFNAQSDEQKRQIDGEASLPASPACTWCEESTSVF